MKHGIFLTLGIGSGVFVWLSGLAMGYFVDPALPLLGYSVDPSLPLAGFPLGFLAVALALIMVLVSIGYCVRLFLSRKTRRNIVLTLAALIGPLVLVIGPRLLNGHDAFVCRMKSYSEEAYHRAAADIATVLHQQGVDRLDAQYYRREGKLLVAFDLLVESHPILAVSEFPLDISIKNDSVRLEWASGLTGGYEARISLHPDPPSEWAGPSGPGLPGPYEILEVTYIYQGVVLLHLP